MATLTKLSYGGTAAVVTGMGVIVGFDAATASKATLVGSLLLIAVADNLADSLAIHAYQESERLAAKQAFRSTVANFVTRFLVAASFLILVLALPSGRLTPAALAWGMALLGTLTYFVARDRGRHRREPGDWHMDSRSASAGDRGREPGPDVRASSAVRLDFDLEVPSFPAVGLGPEESESNGSRLVSRDHDVRVVNPQRRRQGLRDTRGQRRTRSNPRATTPRCGSTDSCPRGAPTALRLRAGQRNNLQSAFSPWLRSRCPTRPAHRRASLAVSTIEMGANDQATITATMEVKSSSVTRLAPASS